MVQSIDGSDISLKGQRVAIVVSSYNGHITGVLAKAAVETLKAAGVEDNDIFQATVPGAWELSLGAKRLADTVSFGAIICLGAVIKGDTTHDQHINRAVSMNLSEISIDYDLPIGFGLLTCNTVEQALQRAGGSVGNKGEEAANAVIEMMRFNLAVESQFAVELAASDPEPA